MSWGGVILSGGQGSRMGYADKSSLIHGEKTFLDIIGNELHSLGVPCYLSRLLIKAENRCKVLLWWRIRSGERMGNGLGPMGGIWSCLEQTAEPFLFFVSCDMPLFRGRMAECLLKYWKPEWMLFCGAPGTAAAAHVRSVFQNLPAGTEDPDPFAELSNDGFFGARKLRGGKDRKRTYPGHMVFECKHPGDLQRTWEEATSCPGCQRKEGCGEDMAAGKTGEGTVRGRGTHRGHQT